MPTPCAPVTGVGRAFLPTPGEVRLPHLSRIARAGHPQFRSGKETRKARATLYNLVGVVKRHVACLSSALVLNASFFSYLLESF